MGGNEGCEVSKAAEATLIAPPRPSMPLPRAFFANATLSGLDTPWTGGSCAGGCILSSSP